MTLKILRPAYLLLTVALLTAGCAGHFGDGNGTSLAEMSKQELTATIEERDSLITLISDVTLCLDRINNVESGVITVSGGGSRRQQVSREINALESTLQNKKRQLTAIERNLDVSKEANAQLKKILVELKSLIDTQLTQLSHTRRRMASAGKEQRSMNRRIDSLQNIVTHVSTERDSLLAATDAMERDINVCYYVVGEKSFLKGHGVISTGFLRNSRLRDEDFDAECFTVADRRTLRAVSLGSDKAKVMTRHPKDSYRLTGSGNRRVLEITNQTRFWSLSNYLIVQTDVIH